MKYNNRKTVVDGITFDSKREAARWQQLKLMERGGLIEGLERQVKYELVPRQVRERSVDYYADFVYTDNSNNQQVVEDVKGVRTSTYVIKRKLMLWVHGIRVVEV